MQLIKEISPKKDYRGYNDRYGLFLCPCCLKEVEKRIQNGLRDKSCGCERYKLMSETNIKHGGRGTKLYDVWAGMKQRCLNTKSKRYKDYGGRGITVCNEWLEFTPFRDWAIQNGYKEGLQIDRINNDGNYEPNNCRWATITEQQRNKRNNKLSLEKANEIRDLYGTGNYTHSALKEIYKTDLKTINEIIHNKLWRN